VTEAMSMPTVMAPMAWAAVSPIPIRLDPIVHDDRQIPHVPAGVSFLLERVDDEALTPVAHIGVDAICSFIVRDWVNISISPTACLYGLVLIVCRLDLEPLEEC